MKVRSSGIPIWSRSSTSASTAMVTARMPEARNRSVHSRDVKSQSGSTTWILNGSNCSCLWPSTVELFRSPNAKERDADAARLSLERLDRYPVHR